jgi:hypothetical protein
LNKVKVINLVVGALLITAGAATRSNGSCVIDKKFDGEFVTRFKAVNLKPKPKNVSNWMNGAITNVRLDKLGFVTGVSINFNSHGVNGTRYVNADTSNMPCSKSEQEDISYALQNVRDVKFKAEILGGGKAFWLDSFEVR